MKGDLAHDDVYLSVIHSAGNTWWSCAVGNPSCGQSSGRRATQGAARAAVDPTDGQWPSVVVCWGQACPDQHSSF